jgi:hypothetical protein
VIKEFERGPVTTDRAMKHGSKGKGIGWCEVQR